VSTVILELSEEIVVELTTEQGPAGPPVDTTTLVQNAGGIAAIRRLTQADYDALDPPDETTLYVIVG
jgi:hypothetical protein